MNDHPEQDATPSTEPTPTSGTVKPPREPAAVNNEPVPGHPVSRLERMRPTGRIGQVAAVLVAIAAAIFIVGSIFVAGFALGSEEGDHHGHGEGHSQDDGARHAGDGDQPDGPGDEAPAQGRSQDDGPGH